MLKGPTTQGTREWQVAVTDGVPVGIGAAELAAGLLQGS